MSFYSHDDARQRLRDYLAVRKACGDRASYRSLAGELGITHTAICSMVRGKVRVNSAVARRIGLRPIDGFIDREAEPESVVTELRG